MRKTIGFTSKTLDFTRKTLDFTRKTVMYDTNGLPYTCSIDIWQAESNMNVASESHTA